MPVPRPADFVHRHVQLGDVRLHVAELGEGPPVIMCHGFPHLWWSWRHQMPVIAAAGFRAVAPDLRGVGETTIAGTTTGRPGDIGQFTNEAVIGDLLGLLDDMGEESAVFAGLDFGASVVWDLALRHPEKVRAVINVNNPYVGRGEVLPSRVWNGMAEEHFTHLVYFLEPDRRAERDLAAEPRRFLTNVFWALSGEYHYLDTWKFPHDGRTYLDVLPEAPPLPWAWLTESELDVYVDSFTRTGFAGGLSWYRALDPNWEANAPFAGAKIEVPTYFAAGERDCDIEGFTGYDPLAAFQRQVADLRGLEIIPEAGHLLTMERPGPLNAVLAGWLGDIGRYSPARS